MVSWLGLFRHTQVVLWGCWTGRTSRCIAEARPDPPHGWLGAMLLGPGDCHLHRGPAGVGETKGAPPDFLAVQLSDMLAFGTLSAAALLLRKDMAAHKRLMLLGTLYISDAGFARWLGDSLGERRHGGHLLVMGGGDGYVGRSFSPPATRPTSLSYWRSAPGTGIANCRRGHPNAYLGPAPGGGGPSRNA